MPKSIYEITTRIVTDSDGLVSTQVIKTRELTSIPEEDDDEDDNINEG